MATFDRAKMLEMTAQKIAARAGVTPPAGTRLVDHYTGAARPIDTDCASCVSDAVEILLPFEALIMTLQGEGDTATRRYVEELNRRQQLDDYIAGIIDRMPAEFTSWSFNEFRAWLETEIQQRPAWPGVAS